MARFKETQAFVFPIAVSEHFWQSAQFKFGFRNIYTGFYF